jgi:hypothetical protein
MMIDWLRALVSVAALTFAGPALAAYQVVLEPAVIVGDYYEQNGRCDGSGSGCTLKFSPVPSDKFLTVRKASCLINSDNIPYSMALGVADASFIRRQEYFPINITSTVENPSRHAAAANLSTEFLVGGNPTLEYRTRGNHSQLTMICQIKGVLTPR